MLGIWLLGMVVSMVAILIAESTFEDRPELYPLLGYPYSLAILLGILPVINLLSAIWLLCKLEEYK